MASTIFQDYNQNNPIVSSWLNDINKGVYSAKGLPRVAQASSAAWVRFSVAGGVVAIQQSNNIAGVVRTAAGIYVISYAVALTNAANCYEITANQVGYTYWSAESVSSVTINTNNLSNVGADPGFVSVVVHGAN